jgi:hypothetical protein
VFVDIERLPQQRRIDDVREILAHSADGLPLAEGGTLKAFPDTFGAEEIDGVIGAENWRECHGVSRGEQNKCRRQQPPAVAYDVTTLRKTLVPSGSSVTLPKNRQLAATRPRVRRRTRFRDTLPFHTRRRIFGL